MRLVTLIDLGAGALPAQTPAPARFARWFPVVHQPAVVPPVDGAGTTPVADGVLLEWDAVESGGAVVIYVIERSLSEAGPWEEVTRTTETRYLYSDGTGQTWYFRITATVRGQAGGSEIVVGTPELVARQQALDQEILDRLAGDFAAVAEAVADARAYTDTQVAALNGILEDIVGADEWVAGTTYPKGDFVRHEGTMYRALAENTGVVPGSNPSVWQEIGEYTSVGDALAAAISMSTQNASDIAVESTRLDGVVARMPPGTDQLARSAQVASEQQARIDGDSALGQRIDTANAAIAGKASTQSVQLLSGRVDTLGDTVVSQGNAITQVTSTANAAVNARPNAITNPYFSPVWPSAGAPGAWTVGVWGWVGGVAAVSQGNKAGGSAYIDSERIPVTPNTSYVASGDMMNLNNTLWGRVVIVWFNGETNIGSVWGTPIAGPFDFHVNNEFDFRKTMAVTGVSPANATHAMVRFNWDFDSNAGSYRVIGVRRPKFENGATPTPFSDDASGFSNAAAVVELKTRTTALEASSSVTTAALASLGGSANLLENSDFANGLDSAPTGWAYAWNPGGWAFVRKRPAGASWEPAGGVSIGAIFDGTPAVNAYGVVYQNGAQVIPGKRYIFSAFTANHRCTTRLAMRFMSSAGANVGEPGTDWSTADGNGGSSLTNWEYRWLSAVAPATAATVDAGVWVTGKAGAAPNPVFWMTRPMLEEASENQTKPSPWSPNGNPKQTAAAYSSMSASVSAIDGRQRAMQVIATDVQGRWIGFRTENDGVRGGTEFVMDYFRLLAADGASASMEMTGNYWRVFNANYQLVMGTGFGVSGNLMSWFGPNIGAANCSTSNCIEARTTAGQTIIRGANNDGRMEITATKISVFDTNNVARIELGLLS